MKVGNLVEIINNNSIFCFPWEVESIIQYMDDNKIEIVSLCSNGSAEGKYIFVLSHKSYEWIDYEFNGDEFVPIRKLMGSEPVTFTPHDWGNEFPVGCTSMEEVRQWLNSHCNNGETWTHYGDNVFYECERQLGLR